MVASSQARKTGTTSLAQVDPQMVVEWFSVVGFFDCIKQLSDFGDVLRGHVSLDFKLDHVFRLSIGVEMQCCVVLRLDECQEN
jgi:hypothetical protein